MTETVPLLGPSTRSRVVRRLPVPVSEPPYDDELPLAQRSAGTDDVRGWGPGGAVARRGDPAPVQGALALSFALPGGAPAVPQPPPGLRLVRSTGRSGADGEEWAEPQPTPRVALPDPAGWAPRLAQAMVEVVGGERPLAQLVRWTSAEVYDRLRRGLGWGRERDPMRAVVRSVTVSEPADGVAEVAAIVRRGPRCTALALRLEGLDGRWQCTALELH